MHLFTIFHSAIRVKITKDLVKHLSLKSKRQMSCINSVAFYAYLSELTQGYFSSATVHLPRIGYNTPSFNWYGTERLVRKYLASKGIETSMYPYLILHSTFRRKKTTKGRFRLQIIILRKETRANPKTNTVLGRKCYHNRY